MSFTVLRMFKPAFFIAAMVVALAVFPSAGISDQLQDGRAAIGSGDYALALELLGPLAESGDPVAQNAMGVLYLQGWGVPSDPERAAAFFQRAADQGDVKGTMNLAHAYRMGNGVPASCQKARQLLEPHAQNGIPAAQVTLGAIYDEGCPDLSADPEQAFRWYAEAAAQSDPYGLGNMASMYALGLGVEQSYAEAIKYYREAAALGNGKAAYHLGRMYEIGQGVPPDSAQAKKWYLEAVQLGEQQAEQRLLALEQGPGAGTAGGTGLLAEALGAPPADLAQSVASIQSVLTMLPLVEAGVTLQLPDGEINKANVEGVRDELTERLAIYREAIEQRGVTAFLSEYVARAERCDYSGSSWAMSIASGYDRVFVTQSGPEVAFEASRKRRRDDEERTAAGISVENAISLVDPMNSDYVLAGEYQDGLISIRPDVDAILRSWPDFIQPPSRVNLSSCVVTLSPPGDSRKAAPGVERAALEFEMPADRSVLYVHRADKFAASEAIFRVELDNEVVGPIARNEYYRLDLDPGDHYLKVWSRDVQGNVSVGELDVALTSGEVSFVEVEPRMGWKTFKMSVEEVSENAGRKLVLEGKALN